MQTKMKIKTGIDLLMTVLLLLLMAYQITGQELHEWFGAGELLLFLLHNILNMKWYGNLFKGKYRLPRIIQTIVNFGVLITMLCLGFSGIVMSRHIFAALSIHGPMATARMMHLAASYWGFVLMSVHLGLHWGMILGMCRKLTGSREKLKAITWILRVMAALLAWLALIHNVFNAVAYPFSGALSNGLRAAGDVKFTMYVSVVSTVAVRLFLSYLLGVTLQMGVIGIALAMVCDWMVRAVLFIWREKPESGKLFR